MIPLKADAACVFRMYKWQELQAVRLKDKILKYVKWTPKANPEKTQSKLKVDAKFPNSRPKVNPESKPSLGILWCQVASYLYCMCKNLSFFMSVT